MNNQNLSEDNEIQDLGSLHHYRTEIPNVIFQMKLGHLLIAAYCVFKSTSGDKGSCFKSNATLCEEIGCSKPTLIQLKKQLEVKGLIIVKKRTHENGASLPDLIQIIDIWEMNWEFFIKLKKNKYSNFNREGKPILPGGVNVVYGGGKASLPKQEHIQQDHSLIKQQQHMDEEISEPQNVVSDVGVVVVPEKNDFEQQETKEFCINDMFLHCKNFSKNWTNADMEYAWLAYEKNKKIVSDPIKYIEGIINKRKVSTSSVDENKNIALKTLQEYVYPTQNLPIQEKDKLIFKNSLRDYYYELSYAAHGFYEQLINAIANVEGRKIAT